MPIFDIVFSRPLAIPLTARCCASLAGHPLRAAGPASTSSRERLEHQVRVDRGGAVADQHREAVHARAARPTRPRARPAGACPRGRGGGGPPTTASSAGIAHALGADGAVGEDQDVRAAGERLVGLVEDRARAPRSIPAGALGDRPGDVERVRLEDRRVAPGGAARAPSRAGSGCRSRAGARARASRRAGSAPSRRSSATLITTASRIESIGGFVTCAKSCLKYE